MAEPFPQPWTGRDVAEPQGEAGLLLRYPSAAAGFSEARLSLIIGVHPGGSGHSMLGSARLAGNGSVDSSCIGEQFRAGHFLETPTGHGRVARVSRLVGGEAPAMPAGTMNVRHEAAAITGKSRNMDLVSGDVGASNQSSCVAPIFTCTCQ